LQASRATRPDGISTSLFLGGLGTELLGRSPVGNYTGRIQVTRSIGYSFETKIYTSGWKGNGRGPTPVNLGRVLNGAGRAFALLSVGYDGYRYRNGEITTGEFATNTLVTGATILLAGASAPLALGGLAIGGAYFAWQYFDPEGHRAFTDSVDELIFR